MKIEQEKIPSALDFFAWDEISVEEGSSISLQELVAERAIKYLNLHLKAIRYEYDQYQFFLDGYRNGSASISEVTAAHDKFLKLLEYEK